MGDAVYGLDVTCLFQGYVIVLRDELDHELEGAHCDWIRQKHDAEDQDDGTYLNDG